MLSAFRSGGGTNAAFAFAAVDSATVVPEALLPPPLSALPLLNRRLLPFLVLRVSAFAAVVSAAFAVPASFWRRGCHRHRHSLVAAAVLGAVAAVAIVGITVAIAGVVSATFAAPALGWCGSCRRLVAA